MAQQIKYVSLENLTLYDSLIKQHVAAADAKSLKTVSIKGNVINFYREESPTDTTAPAYKVELPEVDLASYMRLMEQATAGNVVIAKADGSVADGGVKLTDLAKTADVETKITNAKKPLETRIKANEDAITVLNGTGDGSVSKQVADAKKAVDDKIGSLDDLTTTAKTNMVVAVNEVKGEVDSVKAAGEIVVETATTTEGMAKSYTFKQGSKTIATIDIPKDMVVKSGTVETNPTGQPAGTYLVLTLANATSDKVYINVGTLVDIYKAAANATQIQLAINASTREISASIVAGSVTATELAANAVTTAKIADGNVTKAKLAKDVQTSLGKADSALQEADVATLRTDVSTVKTSLAEGGATDKAIKAAKKAGDDAQAAVDTLTERVGTLEGVTYVEVSKEEINKLFE